MAITFSAHQEVVESEYAPRIKQQDSKWRDPISARAFGEWAGSARASRSYAHQSAYKPGQINMSGEHSN
jgi:hypothetical protein